MWLARVVVLVTAVALFVCVGSTRPTQTAAAPVKPLSQAQLPQLAITEYLKLTPTQMQAVTQLARRIANVPASVARTFPEHASSSKQSSVTTMAVPTAVRAIAVLIVRYGIRNAPQQFNNMMRNTPSDGPAAASFAPGGTPGDGAGSAPGPETAL
jgi:hypothetical protein